VTAAVAAAGLLLVAAALVDLAWTTIAAGSGAGPLTGRLAARLWRVALGIHRRRRSDAFLAFAGVTVVFAVLAVWLLLVLVGWSVAFNASDGAVRDSQTGAPADVVARLYFVGYTVFTLGNGDYRPGDGAWQLATVATTGTGLVLVTLAITYLVPVASAVAQRRQLASTIAALGNTPEEILTTSWDGAGFGSLSQQLLALTPMVQAARQQHLTYPVLHYFHSQEPDSAAAPNLTNLAQALHLLRYGTEPPATVDSAVIVPLERSIDAFLSTLRSAHVEPADPLPLPHVDGLRDAGIPTATDDHYNAGEGPTRHRRALLAGMLADDGWSASDIAR